MRTSSDKVLLVRLVAERERRGGTTGEGYHFNVSVFLVPVLYLHISVLVEAMHTLRCRVACGETLMESPEQQEARGLFFFLFRYEHTTWPFLREADINSFVYQRCIHTNCSPRRCCCKDFSAYRHASASSQVRRIVSKAFWSDDSTFFLLVGRRCFCLMFCVARAEMLRGVRKPRLHEPCLQGRPEEALSVALSCFLSGVHGLTSSKSSNQIQDGS